MHQVNLCLDQIVVYGVNAESKLLKITSCRAKLPQPAWLEDKARDLAAAIPKASLILVCHSTSRSSRSRLSDCSNYRRLQTKLAERQMPGCRMPQNAFKALKVQDGSAKNVRSERLVSCSKQIPLVILTSPATDERTRQFFAENANFGLSKEQVLFAIQVFGHYSFCTPIWKYSASPTPSRGPYPPVE